MNRVFLCVVCLLLLLQCACARNQVPRPNAAAPSIDHPDYVDIKAGWTIRVVIPILKSGGFVLPSIASEQAGDSGNITTDDFIGYEKALYKVEPGGDQGYRIRMTHCETWTHGKKKTCPAPTVDLFKPFGNVRQIRMVYLTRVSRADHDAILVAGNTQQVLDTLTREVTEAGNCGVAAGGICTVVPKGISVNPEASKSR